MAFTRRTVRNGAAAIGIAITMMVALVTPAVAGTNDDARFDGGQTSVASAQLGVTATTPVKRTPVPATGRVSCFGYYGTFLVGTEVIVVDWATTQDECFGISTNRTIWHTWPGAGGWVVMPGGGTGDNMSGVGEITSGDNRGQRAVSVVVYSSASIYCQGYRPGSGWQGYWYRCN